MSIDVSPLLQKLFALARVFGNIPDDLFSREYEQMIFRTVARAGMGPQLLVRRSAAASSTSSCFIDHRYTASSNGREGRRKGVPADKNRPHQGDCPRDKPQGGAELPHDRFPPCTQAEGRLLSEPPTLPALDHLQY